MVSFSITISDTTPKITHSRLEGLCGIRGTPPRSWWTFPLNREHLIALSIFKKDESAKEIIASSEQFLHARFGQTVSASEPAVENVSEALKERQLLRIESIPSKGRVGRGVIMGTGFWFLSHIIDSMENRIRKIEADNEKLRDREIELLWDYALVEDENISLQEQVMQLSQLNIAMTQRLNEIEEIAARLDEASLEEEKGEEEEDVGSGKVSVP